MEMTGGVVFSYSALVAGSAYELYTGGSSTGTVTDGLYEDGTYSAGSQVASFSVGGMVTTLNAP